MTEWRAWTRFCLGVIVSCALPLAPLIVEYAILDGFSVRSLMITAILYSVTVALTAEDRLSFSLAVLYTTTWSAAYIVVISDPFGQFLFRAEAVSIFAICAFALVHVIQRFLTHVVGGHDFIHEGEKCSR